MKLKAQPKKPVRGTEKHYITISYGMSIADVLEQIGPSVNPDTCLFHDFGFGYDSIVYEVPESDQSFAQRLATYEKAMAAYAAWYEENKEAIEEELKYRENKTRLEKEKKIAELEASIAKLRGNK